MKRELKLTSVAGQLVPCDHCKAHPDEKGIETIERFSHVNSPMYCKAHPDEKGIETTMSVLARLSCNSKIAKPIPMKRELKLVVIYMDM